MQNQEKTKFYQANTKKLFTELIDGINIGENEEELKRYKYELKYFYTDLIKYTQKVYLNFEVIRSLTGLDRQKAADLDLKLLLQLPFILRYLEQEECWTSNVLVQLLGWEEYVKIIGQLEIQHFPVAKENNLTDDLGFDLNSAYSYMTELRKKDLIVFKKNLEVMEILKE